MSDIEDIFEDIDWQEQEQNSPQEFVMGFREGQERFGGGAQIMGSVIEGGGRLARLQELQLKKDPASRLEIRFMETFFNIKKLLEYDFGKGAEETLKDNFLRLRHSLYKDPALFLFATIVLYSARGKITKKALDDTMKLALKTEYIFQREDLIRYCRLLGA